MSQSFNPFASRAAIQELLADQEHAAEAREVAETRADADADELHELEQSQVQELGLVADPHVSAAPRRRSLLARLLRR